MLNVLISHILTVMIIIPLIGSIITLLLSFKSDKIASLFAILISPVSYTHLTLPTN